jgi:hypothetical protein
MLQDAERHLFDVLFIEHADRATRAAEVATKTFNKLRRLGIEVHSAREGTWTLFHAAIFGAMSEEQRMRLSELTRSGKLKLAIQNLWPGRPPHGYSAVEGAVGILKKNDKMANVIRIFQLRRDRHSYQTIANIMHDENRLSPSGSKFWWAETIAKILRNSMYVGVALYGVQSREKYEEDGKIKIKIHDVDSSKWVYVERTDWIVDEIEDLWDEVQRINDEEKKPTTGPHSKYLLSKTVFCGACGSSMTTSEGHGERYLECRANKDSLRKKTAKPCSNKTVKLALVEESVIELVCQKLHQPKAFNAMRAGFERRARAKMAIVNGERDDVQRQRDTVDRQIAGTLDAAIVAGLTPKVLADQRMQLCKQLDVLDAKLATLPVVSVSIRLDIVPTAPSDFLGVLVPARSYTKCSEPVARLRDTFRRLVGRVEVTAQPDGRVDIKLNGLLADVTGEASIVRYRHDYGGPRQRKAQEMARSGSFRLTSDAWQLVSQAVPTEPIWVDGADQPLDFKSTVEAILYLRNTHMRHNRVPKEVWGGSWHVLARAHGRLGFFGILDRIRTALIATEFESLSKIRLVSDAARTDAPDPIQRYIELNLRRRAKIIARAARRNSSNC